MKRNVILKATVSSFGPCLGVGSQSPG